MIKQFQQIEQQQKKSTNKTFTKTKPEAQTISPNDENGTTTKHSPQPPSMFILVQSSENADNIMHSLRTIDDKEGT